MIAQKIDLLREQMRAKGYSAYLVPSADPHQSEYVAENWELRAWISGFTGSAGTFVITLDKAALWTDARYYLQGEQQLKGSEIILQRMGKESTPSIQAWLSAELKPEDTLGLSAITSSYAMYRGLSQALSPKGIRVVTGEDLIAHIWNDRPAAKSAPIFIYGVAYAGESAKDKIERLRKAYQDAGNDALLICALDEIAWTLNLRGSDVDFNPVFYSYLYIGKSDAYLFVADDQVNDEVRNYLLDLGLQCKPYQEIFNFMSQVSNLKVQLDDQVTNMAVIESIKSAEIETGISPVRRFKAIKNEVEIKHGKEAMVKDGVALTKAFMWMHAQWKKGGMTEYELGKQLAVFRAQQKDYISESFNPIVGWKGNGAIIHYKAEEATAATISGEGMLLVDSGGQYLDGTTDITRTFYLGTPTAEHKDCYTLVLKGHVALSKAKFPKNTLGIQLDTMARMYLWNDAKNYGHGTGHGVGQFMNVHEPPQGFADSLNERGKTPMEVGMLSSNEPGLYKDNHFGIRVENLFVTVPYMETEFGAFLRFETTTLFPYERKLINTSLLLEDEKAWINSYHNKVFAKLSPHLNEVEVNWLKELCAPIY